MLVWAVANQKGGVGKTTTTVALGGIAASAGLRVLLVDLDAHGSLTSYFRLDPDQQVTSTYTIFEKRRELNVALIESIIVKSDYENLKVLPASTLLATLERQGIGDGMGLVVGKALQMLRGKFDLVVIDCPPQLGVLMVNALACCQELIIPVQTEFLALKGLERILHTIKMMNRSRNQDLSYLIVPTMFDRRTHASVTSLRTIRNSYGQDVWPGKIPVDTRFRDASKAGVPPHIFDPSGRGVANYQSLFMHLQAQKYGHRAKMSHS